MSVAAAWTCERSVDVEVPVSFAWEYMTDVRNWDDPPAEFTLDGPFVAGARGTTRMPEQPLLWWTISALDSGRGYTIEGDSLLERATVVAHWRFEPLTEGTATLTQRLELFGDNAAAYIDQIQAMFEPNMEPGMRRIARLMERRHAEAQAC